jgi:hypothetical protein
MDSERKPWHYVVPQAIDCISKLATAGFAGIDFQLLNLNSILVSILYHMKPI